MDCGIDGDRQMMGTNERSRQRGGHVREVWYVYLARCADGSIYTGIALDVDRREAQHNAGKGSRYTRGRRPVAIVYREKCGTRSEALRRESGLRRSWREKKAFAGLEGRPSVRRQMNVCRVGLRCRG